MHGFSRRNFMQLAGGMTALGMLDPLRVAQALEPSNTRLSWRAFRTAEAEGAWNLSDIEGEIPKELNGTLYRIGPGQKENHGVLLKHFFDGDAFVMGFRMREGKAALRAQFIATPEREEELKAGRMIYNEFGTLAPRDPARPAAETKPQKFDASALKSKNQGSINIIPWDGKMLCLSEGGHPTAIDPATFSFSGYWDFHGTLPAMVPMTAHPKYDIATGEGFMYGIRQGFPPAILVYRMGKDGRLAPLHEIKVPSFLMIHDMIMTKQHLVFVAPPVKMNPMDLFTGKSTIADALKYFETEPLRIFIVRRDGTGGVVVAEQPANIVFHNGNGFEREDGKLVLDTMLAPNGDTVLKAIYAWSETKLPEPAQGIFTRLVIDPATGAVESRTDINPDQEFPRFNQRLAGTDLRYLYTGQTSLADDPFAFTHLIKNDLHQQKNVMIQTDAGRAMGEPVFVSRPGAENEDDGWVMVMAYDTNRDETCLEIRDAGTLDLAARIWTGLHLPLGFHGNFVNGSFVEV